MPRPFVVAAVLFAARSAWGSVETPFPQGVVIDRVVCTDDASQSYALFLPAGYGTSMGKTWPILYLFDARARGGFAAKRFAGAAAELGFIVASSNNTRSDAPVDPNITAFRALWRDTHARFAIDPRRVYAGGYSGGARVATLMATTAPGTVAGVIGCGAAFYRPPKEKPPFFYFGAVGNRDFNYDEMRELDETLHRLGAVRHIEIFDGEHSWPPEDICGAALEWMQFQAGLAGLIPDDPALADRLLRRFAGRAEALERSGHPWAAMVEYERAIEDFKGRRDVSSLERALARLQASAEGLRARRDERARIMRDDAYRDRLTRVWTEIRSGAPLPLAQLLEELDIAGLKARATKDPASDDALSAERLLSEIFVQTTFYLPRGYRQEKNYERAILCISIAAEIRPESASAWYDLAALESLAGRRDKALDDLATAVARGYSDSEELSHDPDFASIRDSDRFRALLEGLKKSRSGAGLS